MPRISRVAITTILSLIFGVASLAAAENTLSDKVPVYTLREIVCTAERTPSQPEMAVLLADMSNIGIVMATTDNMLTILDEEEVYELPEVVCTGKRTASMAEILIALQDMDNMDIAMETDNMLSALEVEAYMLPERFHRKDAFRPPPHRPGRMIAGMRV